jgi:hypothetical protein
MQLERGRYRRENNQIIVDVAVKNSRQLFNERDPAPFRERAYVLSSVQEFPLKTPMKLRIAIREESDQQVEQIVLREAIQAYFTYESHLTQTTLRKRLKIGRWFFIVGLITLFACLSVAQLFGTLEASSKVWSIASEGFVIIGWVAMWRPIELLLYDWWPLREQRLYLAKVAAMKVEVQCSESQK